MSYKFYESQLIIHPTDKIMIINNDEYILKRKLGQGLTSIVYSMIKKNDNRDDFKFPVLKLCTNKAFQKIYLNEKNILSTLKESSNYTKFSHHIAEIENVHVDGKYIQFKECLNPIKTLKINHVYDLIDCIAYLVDTNIIHRDVRPENIMVSYDEKYAKLIDFGFAFVSNVDDNDNDHTAAADDDDDDKSSTTAIPIAGTIHFGLYNFLKTVRMIPRIFLVIEYKYEKWYDLACLLNSIVYHHNDHIKSTIVYIKTDLIQEKANRCLDIWAEIRKNEQYKKIFEMFESMNKNMDIIKLKNVLKLLFE
ncbi:unnamed protein product [Didymodactylos carnosus]|uniref:Protein kinase domain-containing protein n=1 Tax=Didymodactylos carnosus TaxID=1234261 RepID=A0A815DD22_9BILA|nr:unnamed protein product [Didymodactylos carnosus]CAF4099151.1 unnamed protein product [Didymodactylos carnosus]